MWEHRKKPLSSRAIFIRRLIYCLGIDCLFILFSLGIGMAGYHYIENLPWVDAYLEASMIFAGMGAIAKMESVAGKIFAGTYALYAAFALLVSLGVILAPIIHRFLHTFHLDIEEINSKKK